MLKKNCPHVMFAPAKIPAGITNILATRCWKPFNTKIMTGNQMASIRPVVFLAAKCNHAPMQTITQLRSSILEEIRPANLPKDMIIMLLVTSSPPPSRIQIKAIGNTEAPSKVATPPHSCGMPLTILNRQDIRSRCIRRPKRSRLPMWGCWIVLWRSFCREQPVKFPVGINRTKP